MILSNVSIFLHKTHLGRVLFCLFVCFLKIWTSLASLLIAENSQSVSTSAMAARAPPVQLQRLGIYSTQRQAKESNQLTWACPCCSQVQVQVSSVTRVCGLDTSMNTSLILALNTLRSQWSPSGPL